MNATTEPNEQLENLQNLGTGCFIQTLPPEYQAFQVSWNSSYWLAKFYRPDCQMNLQPGDRVIVLKMEGIILLIVPENQTNYHHGEL